jgi:hypothetical protein
VPGDTGAQDVVVVQPVNDAGAIGR